ncbi:MAG: hypothetical protein AAF633_15835 [Chloroflexota bacterium]
MVNLYSTSSETFGDEEHCTGKFIKRSVHTARSEELYICALSEPLNPKTEGASVIIDFILDSLITGLKQSRARIIPLILQDSIKHANRTLIEFQDKEGIPHIPCTLTLAVISQNELFIASVGSSEVLLFQNDKIKWLQTKYSTPVPNQETSLGSKSYLTIRNIPSLDEKSYSGAAFTGITLKQDAKLLISSSSIIDYLIMRSPSYFSDIERLLKEAELPNAEGSISKWIFENELMPDSPITIFFNQPPPAEAVQFNNKKITPIINKMPSQPANGHATESVFKDMPEAAFRDESTRANQAQALEEAGPMLEPSAVEAVEIEVEDESIDQSQRLIQALNPSSGQEHQTLSPFESRIPANGEAIFDPLPEMTRQSPVQIARAAFPVMDLEELDDEYVPQVRMSSVQIFFSIFIILSLTILILVVLTVLWGEFL